MALSEMNVHTNGQSVDPQIDYSYFPQLSGHLLGLAHLRATQICIKVLEPLKLTPKQYVAIEFISKNPHISQKEIAKHIGTTPTVLVNVLDVLTKRGYVQRQPSLRDRRQHTVAVTEAGLAILDEVRRMAFEAEELFIEETGLTPDERSQLLVLLRKMTKR